MKVEAKIQKWGNGLALRVSGVLRDIPHFKEGMLVEIDVNEEGFVLKKRNLQKNTRFPFNEDQLLEGLTPELAHADLLATPSAKEVGESCVQTTYLNVIISSGWTLSPQKDVRLENIVRPLFYLQKHITKKQVLLSAAPSAQAFEVVQPKF
tara:strand:+ start:47692 stop:48144 length:453 start_codon:yes stop_codon:yes gene_type:complete